MRLGARKMAAQNRIGTKQKRIFERAENKRSRHKRTEELQPKRILREPQQVLFQLAAAISS